jgi:hypothetical protein
MWSVRLVGPTYRFEKFELVVFAIPLNRPLNTYRPDRPEALSVSDRVSWYALFVYVSNDGARADVITLRLAATMVEGAVAVPLPTEMLIEPVPVPSAAIDAGVWSQV